MFYSSAVLLACNCIIAFVAICTKLRNSSFSAELAHTNCFFMLKAIVTAQTNMCYICGAVQLDLVTKGHAAPLVYVLCVFGLAPNIASFLLASSLYVQYVLHVLWPHADRQLFQCHPTKLLCLRISA